MNRGIVLSAPDSTIQDRAKAAKFGLVVDASRPFAFEKTLFVEPGTQVPWDLLPAAWHFLARWDAAVPLWRYGMTAADIGSKEERIATQAVVRDLRVLLHSWELLFVRQNDAGCALVDAWKREYAGGADKRLAFLRALYIVKPRLCVLPTSWLANIQQDKQLAKPAAARALAQPSRGAALIQVEVAPGRIVKCRPGDEAKVREQFKRQQAPGRRR